MVESFIGKRRLLSPGMRIRFVTRLYSEDLPFVCKRPKNSLTFRRRIGRYNLAVNQSLRLGARLETSLALGTVLEQQQASSKAKDLRFRVWKRNRQCGALDKLCACFTASGLCAVSARALERREADIDPVRRARGDRV